MKKLLFCLAIVLLAGLVSFSRVEVREKILTKRFDRVSDNMIFIPFELVPKYNAIEIHSNSSEIGWALFGLTEEGKQMKEIDIPAYIEGKPVVCLMTGAFFQCPNLVSVTIPDTIRRSFKYVFAYCPKLKSITSTGDFFDAVGGVNSPIFAECNVSEWNYLGDGLEFEFSFAPIEE